MYPLFAFGIPALLAIFLFEFLNAQMFFSLGEDQSYSFEFLRFVHVIPAFVFAYISDKHYRKGALLASHVLGLATSCLLYFFGLHFWTVFLVAIAFNPMSVARASLIDNFPNHSPLTLMAVAFIVKSLPWIGFFWMDVYAINQFNVIQWVLILFFINGLLILVLFQDRKDLFFQTHPMRTQGFLQKVDRRTTFTVMAFILAETTIRMTWGRVWHGGQDVALLISITSVALAIGSMSAMLYKRLPHMSIITLTYVTGVCMMLIAMLGHFFGMASYHYGFVSIMSYYCIIAGLNNPLVADAVITMFGPRRKAMGAVMIDLSEAISLSLGAFAITVVPPSFYTVAVMALMLFLSASCLQRHVERRQE